MSELPLPSADTIARQKMLAEKRYLTFSPFRPYVRLQ